MSGPRSPLAPFAHMMRDVDPNGARKLAAKLWHDAGIVILLPDSIARMDWQDREFVGAVAGRLYGKREGFGSDGYGDTE